MKTFFASRTRIGWFSLFALVCLLASSGFAASRDPKIGRWDKKGRYFPTPTRQKFLAAHGLSDTSIPRYPIVLVHGLFGFDTLKAGPFVFKYFVGVAEHLREQGMQVFVPETTPFASFEHRAKQLKEQILTTGWEKFHLIAHSAGGLDSRYMITHLGMADKVVSLTTVSTPHRGTWYADFAVKWVMEKQKFWKVWDWLGIRREGVPGISIRGMETFNAQTPDMPGVRYFSFGGYQSAAQIMPPLSTAKVIISIAEKAAAGKRPGFFDRIKLAAFTPKGFRSRLKKAPLEATRELTGTTPDWIIPELAGKNDGLVSLSSARWGEYQADLNVDHLDEMGWFTFFNVKRFYRNITRMLADAGL